ncbi:MAG: nucleotidyltransferase family protein [Calditrichaeota bacterium]|nr:MAG: nucleotidyltransferase family protein [Calditrichota bacterium]
MKAFLLAAGFGTRLKPITDSVPKCLVPISGRPLIEFWFDLFKKYGVTEVLINTHYLVEEVESYFTNRKNDGIKITLINEKKLLGSAGTIRDNKEFVKGEEYFAVFYADNLTNLNIQNLENFHKSHKFPVTVGVFRTETPKACGILETDSTQTVVSFEEKPQNPKSNLANGGVYIFDSKVIDSIAKGDIIDVGYDLLPQFVSRMKAWEIDGILHDIGTHENLAKAEKLLKEF